MRLAELAPAGRVVAPEPCELGTLDAKEWFVAPRARHLEPGLGFRERGFDLTRSLHVLDVAESAHAHELRRELPQSGACAHRRNREAGDLMVPAYGVAAPAREIAGAHKALVKRLGTWRRETRGVASPTPMRRKMPRQ